MGSCEITPAVAWAGECYGLTSAMMRISPEEADALKERVAEEV